MSQADVFRLAFFHGRPRQTRRAIYQKNPSVNVGAGRIGTGRADSEFAVSALLS